MALPFHLVFLLCLTGGLLISGTWSTRIARHARGCPAGWTTLGSRCFVARTARKTMVDAELSCISLGGNLASIHNIEENDLVEKLTLGYNQDVWIGLFDKLREGTWMWTDGTKADFTKWGGREPNNVNGGEDCVNLSIKHYGKPVWNDVPCARVYPYLCARDQ